MIKKIQKLQSKKSKLANAIQRETKALATAEAERDSLISKLITDENETDVGVVYHRDVKLKNNTVEKIQVRLQNLKTAQEALDKELLVLSQKLKQDSFEKFEAIVVDMEKKEKIATEDYEESLQIMQEKAGALNETQNEASLLSESKAGFLNRISPEKILEIISTKNYTGINYFDATVFGLKEEFLQWEADAKEQNVKETEKFRAEKQKELAHKKMLLDEANKWFKNKWTPWDYTSGLHSPEELMKVWITEGINPKEYYVFDRSLVRRKKEPEAEAEPERRNLVQKGVEVLISSVTG